MEKRAAEQFKNPTKQDERFELLREIAEPGTSAGDSFQEIRDLKAEVERLKHPNLMYRRPGASKHEKITSYLDDVDTRLKNLEYSDK